MKKARKPMESPSIRIYEEMVKKRLLNNLCWLIVLGLLHAVQPCSAGTQPAFLILSDGINISDEADRLENRGARIHQRVPPQILVVDLPDSIDPKQILSIRTLYLSVIPLSALEPMGSVAVAAGVQWNRRMLADAKTAGQKNLGAMRSMVAQKSLPAPLGVNATPAGASIHATWDATFGALSYEIEVALDESFSKRVCHTRTNGLETTMPAPEGNEPLTVYVRVRGIDHAAGEHKAEDDATGAWSKPAALDINANPSDTSQSGPQPMSPLPNFESEGFTLILEWNAGTSPQNRVQVSRTEKFDDTLFDAVAQGREFICPSAALHAGDALYWRVKAWGDKKSPWSDARKLTVGPPHHDMSDMFINPEAPR